MSDYSGLRKEYSKFELLESNVDTNPFRQFEKWFNDAVEANHPEPNAMTLATVRSDGMPSARTVLLKGVDDQGFVFYTNYTSAKGQALASTPMACLNFLWLGLERQVRISGHIEKVSREESAAYFHSRSRDSQIGVWVSRQSEVVPSREYLDQKMAEMKEHFSQSEIIPLPSYWGGYRLLPIEIEFWQGRQNRLHDRLLYSKSHSGQWLISRLSP